MQDYGYLFDVNAPGRTDVTYEPRHRAPHRAPHHTSHAAPAVPHAGDLPRIRSYDDLAAPQPAHAPTPFEELFAAATEGPSREPLLGRRARTWRPGAFFTGVVVPTCAGALALCIVTSPLASAAIDRLADRAHAPTGVTAVFAGADGVTRPLVDVTCNDVFAEITSGAVAVSGAPDGKPPAAVVDHSVLDEQLDKIAALPKGDIGRQAIACQGLATWPGATPAQRTVVVTTTVRGGRGNAATTVAWVHRDPKPVKTPAKAQKKP